MPIDIAEFRRTFARLSGLADDDLRALIEAVRTTTSGAGTRVIAPEQTSDVLYLVWQGHVRVDIGSDEQPVHLGEFGPGKWVGEMGMIDPAPATATVTALDDCVLLALSHDRFMALRRERPALTSALLRTLSQDLAERLRLSMQFLDEGGVPPGGGGATRDRQGWFAEAARRLMGLAARTGT